MESDPLGMAAGANTYWYADGSPLRNIDPLGLAVSGSWMGSPRFNPQGSGIDGWQFVSPSWSWWGYVKSIRLHGHANGFINIDVKCNDDCRKWEIHDRVNVDAAGSFDVGPNLYAFGIGLATRNPWAGLGANIVLGGFATLQAEQHFLQLAHDKAGTLIATILKDGPTAMCIATSRQWH